MSSALYSFLLPTSTNRLSSFINKHVPNITDIHCKCDKRLPNKRIQPITNPSHVFGFRMKANDKKTGFTIHDPYLYTKTFGQQGGGHLVTKPLTNRECHCETKPDGKTLRFEIDNDGNLPLETLEMTHIHKTQNGISYIQAGDAAIAHTHVGESASCPAGEYMSAAGCASIKCPQGTYLGLEGCIACPEGQTSPYPGAGFCTDSGDSYVHDPNPSAGSYVHSHEDGTIAHTHATSQDCSNNAGTLGMYIQSSNGKTNYCCTIYDLKSGECLDASSVCHNSTVKNSGGDGLNNCLKGRSFPDCSGSQTKYRGVNLSAYDGGNLAGGQADTTAETPYAGCKDNMGNTIACGLCSDDFGDTGGYSIAKKAKEDPVAISSRFTTGSKASWQPDSSSSPIAPLGNSPLYATVYTLTSQIDSAINQGVNIFRIPFMPTFIDNLTTGWAKDSIVDINGGGKRAYIYISPNPEYINFYMTTVNYIIETYPTKDIKIIIDSHVYQRWCPMNIPGTSSCLAADVDPGIAPPRKYSMNRTADRMCPYKVMAPVGDMPSLDSLLPNMAVNHSDWKVTSGTDKGWGNIDSSKNITAANIGNWWAQTDGHYCKSAIDISNTSETDFNNLEGLLKINPHGCIDDTLGGNNCYGPPTKRILGPDCTVAMWYNILNTEFNLLDICGNYRTDHTSGKPPIKGTLSTYFSDSAVHSHIFIGLMNEPNEVNTDDLGKTYGLLFVLFRRMFKNPLTLLVEGNSWGGLHAQCDPITDGLASVSDTVRLEALKDYANGKTNHEAWRTGEMLDISAALKVSDTKALDYFNLDPKSQEDCVNYPCEIIRKAIETEMSGNGLDYYSDSERNPWMYDVHQYMDKNSTGGNPCAHFTGADSKKNATPISNISGMEDFTNFVPFMKWARWNKIKVIATEFGAQIQGETESETEIGGGGGGQWQTAGTRLSSRGVPCPAASAGTVCSVPPTGPWGCNNRLNLFINMLEQQDYDDIIQGWTIWRAPPSISWLLHPHLVGQPGTPVGLWTNSIIFGPTEKQPWTAEEKSIFSVMYDQVVAPFTDPKFWTFGAADSNYQTAELKKHFCMPELWKLEGTSWWDKSDTFWDKYVNLKWQAGPAPGPT